MEDDAPLGAWQTARALAYSSKLVDVTLVDPAALSRIGRLTENNAIQSMLEKIGVLSSFRLLRT